MLIPIVNQVLMKIVIDHIVALGTFADNRSIVDQAMIWLGYMWSYFLHYLHFWKPFALVSERYHTG